MVTYKLPFFNEIDINQLEEYYNVEIEYKQHEISIDLNFKGKQTEVSGFDKMRDILGNISRLDEKNKSHITADYLAEDGDTVNEYVEFHLEELGEEGLDGIVDFNNDKISPKQQLINQLKLVRIGFYPDGKYESEVFAVFDYSINTEITDQLIVVNTNEKGEIQNLAWES